LLYESRGGTAFVTIARPHVHNAIDRKTLEELAEVFAGVERDPTIRVAILTGSGEKAFAAGADIRELASLSEEEGHSFAASGQRVLDGIEGMAKPVIAAVNGYALGGGCELALACTFRIASESALFGQPEVRLGLIPGYGGSQRLPRLVGRSRALEILLTGQTLSAADALEIGLVDRVVPAPELGAAAESLADLICSNAPLAVRYCLEAVRCGLDGTLAEGQRLEARLFGRCCGTQDMKEGTRAFLEKREASFRGQ